MYILVTPRQYLFCVGYKRNADEGHILRVLS